jgi:predicted nucleic acid-binding Zn ribbon protein
MPIYEYYCPDNHTVYQFYAKTLAQGKTIPRCPDNPAFRMRKLISAFAITRGGAEAPPTDAAAPAAPAEDARMEQALGAMEREFSSVDENDPRAMARMMRRMSELTGERIDGEMEEVMRKLEEGADPESLEDQLGGGPEDGEGGPEGMGGPQPAGTAAEPKAGRHRYRVRRTAPRRDPRLHDYE